MLLSVKEYALREEVSPSTIQRRINRGELKGHKLGRAWYVEFEPKDLEEDIAHFAALEEEAHGLESDEETHNIDKWAAGEGDQPALKELIRFSAKALNSYLLMSDRLLEEKDQTLEQVTQELKSTQQRVAELESYVKMLEAMVFSDRSRPTLGPSTRAASRSLPAPEAAKPATTPRKTPKVFDLSGVYNELT